MHRYSPKVYSIGLGMLRNEQDARDVVQETFLNVHRRLDSFRGDAALSSWIGRIATNNALMTAPVPEPPMSLPSPTAPMTCEELATRLFDYVEGDLSDAECTRLEQHLGGCADCAELVRIYSAVGSLVRTALDVEVDDTLQAELDAAIFEALADIA